jgi:membrane-associated phospholipid phosphatase
VNQSTRPEEARARFGVRSVLAFAAVFIAAVPFAIVVALVTTSSRSLLQVDRGTATDLHRFAGEHPGFASAMRTISNMGSPVAWWIVLTPVFAWLLYRRLPRLAVFLAVTAIGSSLLNRAIKAAVDRARPNLVDPIATAAGKSFPSGHTQSAVVGCGILVLVFLPVVRPRARPWLLAAASLVVLLIGFSRIALGVHYLSDVVGAVLIGLAWLLGMTAAFSVWRREERKPPVHLDEGLEPEHRERISPGPADDGAREHR